MAQRPDPIAPLEAFALDMPGAFRDTPWEGDVVAKVGKKIFVFFGSGRGPDAAISVKLPESADHALSIEAPARRRTGSAATAGSPCRSPTPRRISSRTGSRRATGRSPRRSSSPSSTPAADQAPLIGAPGRDATTPTCVRCANEP